MEIKIKNYEYGHIISHTFPGLFLLFEIILAFKLVMPLDFLCYLRAIRIESTILLIIILFVLSTLLGIILDASHHYIFRNYEKPILAPEVYRHINSSEKLEIYRQVRDADNYYYYECYANMCLAMIPGILIFPIWFWELDLPFWLIIIFLLLYIGIILILFNQAKTAILEIEEIDMKLIQNFSGKNSNQDIETNSKPESPKQRK